MSASPKSLSSSPKALSELGIKANLRLGPDSDPAIRCVAVDSRLVGPGALFAALPGAKAHGADHAAAALQAGAAAILTDLEGAVRLRAATGGLNAPVLVCAAPRRALAHAAARFENRQPQTVVAVTGTNGKTSTASFAADLWAALGRPTARFGTVEVWGRNLPGGDLDEPPTLTTPEPTTLHALLGRLTDLGATHVAMEASSHGLDQARLDGVRLAAGAFTGFSRDHLDYHGTESAYFAAKARLFAELLPAGAAAILNADDPTAPALREIAAARALRIVAFGVSAPADGLRLVARDAHIAGQTIRIGFEGRTRAMESPMVGAFQAMNALAAAALAIGCGEEPEAVFDAMATLKGVRGRMELAARRSNGAGVYVDYAHTPDAVATALAALRPHAPGRLHIVLGAGGDRDSGKRPLMGRAAADGADRVIVTDDNPRTEDPAAIRRAVREGCPDAVEIGDRAEAILTAVDGLEPGDALLIAGKGHEPGQTIGREVRPFDDADQARAAVAALDGPGADGASNAVDER